MGMYSQVLAFNLIHSIWETLAMLGW